tara:strand:- start:5712 stop:7934 length:2223 start_codon:yes stop_codon:yes gene_type:complete
MVNNNIWLGAGTTVTMVPETDLYVKLTATSSSAGTGAFSHLWKVQTHADFSGKYSLVDDLYVGCVADIYNSSNTYQSTHVIAKNTGDLIYFNVDPSKVSGDYLIIRKYGSPVPSTKGTGNVTLQDATVSAAGTNIAASLSILDNAEILGSGITSGTGGEIKLNLTAHQTVLTFATSTATNYEDNDGGHHGFFTLSIAGMDATETLAVHFDDDNTAAKSSGANRDITVDILTASPFDDGNTIAEAVRLALADEDLVVVRTNNQLTITNSVGGYVANTTEDTNGGVTVTSNTAGGVCTSATVISVGTGYGANDTGRTITITNSAGDDPQIAVTMQSAGGARLLADNWLGLVNTVSFPNSEVEMKQMNLGIGGSRSWTHQYKGIETAQGGNLDISAHHGLWLYYALGECLTVSGADSDNGGVASGGLTTSHSNAILYHSESIEKTGPVFYRAVGNNICPPVSPLDATEAEMDRITSLPSGTSQMSNGITYTFGESNGSTLPSFALESVYSKLSATTPYKTTQSPPTADDEAFVRIATGNMVNTLTMSANENEELKMTLDLNTKGIVQPNATYEARNAVENERAFFGYGSANADASVMIQEFMTPFFFYDGTISAYGQDYLKITNMTLTINNNLQDKRYVGGYDRKNKYAVAAQRTYELSLTGYVTDSKVFQDLRNESEESTSHITLLFQKDNGEKIELKFKDYYTTSNNWPVPDDKGAVPVEWTIMPRNLQSCTVISHAVLMG